MDYIKGHFPSLLQFDLPDVMDVMEVIGNLKISAEGHDEIGASLVKSVSSSITEPLIAKVILLYKSGDPIYFTNYRPTSFLPSFSKILEELVQC
jgi:hypothetical protein